MRMDLQRGLVVMVAAGVALAALSFVDAWVVHHRVVSGEGYRDVVTTLGPWDLATVPVLTAGVVIALLTAALAGAALIGRTDPLPSWILPLGAAAGLGLIAATLVPIGQDGHASQIDLRPGWAVLGAIPAAAVMLAGGAAIVRPGRGSVAILAALAGVLAVGGAAGSWLVLQARAGSNEAWSAGSYTREAVDGEVLTLTLGDGRYAVDDRWAGTWESSGGTVVVDNDPACPNARGTYHAHAHPDPGDENLRFVKVVDICAGGSRAADLEAGIWVRDP